MLSDSMFCETTVTTAPDDVARTPLIKLLVSHPTPLRIVVAERDQIRYLDTEWSGAGVYVLLDRPASNGSWKGYVGKSAASGGIKRRLSLHIRDKEKPDWYRAVAVCPTGVGWDEAEVTWLEGELYRSLVRSNGVALLNNQEPGSGRLSGGRQMRLRGVDSAVRCVLALIGHSLNVSEDDTKDHRSENLKADIEDLGTVRPGKLSALIEAGLLNAGARLVPVDTRRTLHGRVKPNGCIEVGSDLYSSPSSAGKAANGGISTNGWMFWALDTSDGLTLNDLRTHHRSGTKPPDLPSDKAQKFFGVGLDEIVAAGLLAPGTNLVSTVNKWPGAGIVHQDGRIEISGNLYNSPSAAGQAVKGGNRPNGWTFWAIATPDGVTLADLRDRFLKQGH